MKNMSLEKIAQACGGVYHGSEEMKQSIVESITTDSRQAAKGCLFVAIPGERVDGHDFIPSVFEKRQRRASVVRLLSGDPVCLWGRGRHLCRLP